MAEKGRQVADNFAVFGERQQHEAALLVVEAAQLRLWPVGPGMRLTRNTEKLGLGIDLRHRAHQPRAVPRPGRPDHDRLGGRWFHCRLAVALWEACPAVTH